jgi:hypothetical protein
MFLGILMRSQGKTILAPGIRSNEPRPYDGGSDGGNISGDVAGASGRGAAHLCWFKYHVMFNMSSLLYFSTDSVFRSVLPVLFLPGLILNTLLIVLKLDVSGKD